MELQFLPVNSRYVCHILNLIGLSSLLVATTAQNAPVFGEKLSEGSTIIPTNGSSVLQCPVENFNTGEHSIYWYRQLNSGYRMAIYKDGALLDGLGLEGEAYMNLHGIGNVLIKFTDRRLIDFLQFSIYTCEVVNREGALRLQSKGLLVILYYPPSEGYPQCQLANFQSIGQLVTITCSSEAGNPYVLLEWWRNGEMIEGIEETVSGQRVYLYYSFVLQYNDLNATFQCRANWQFSWSRVCDFKVPLLTIISTPQTTVPTNGKSDISLGGLIAGGAGLLLMLFIVMLAGIFCYLRRRNSDNREIGNTLTQQNSIYFNANNNVSDSEAPTNIYNEI